MLLLLIACTSWVRTPTPDAADPAVQVRFRPTQAPPTDLAETVVKRVPGATWDLGLEQAASLLVRQARSPVIRIPPASQAHALAAAGYPGQATFRTWVNGGAVPEQLLEELAHSALRRDQAVDVALVSRAFEGNQTLWIAAVSPRPVLLDPIPRDLELDQPVPIGIEVLGGEWDTLTLYVDAPMRGVESIELLDGVAHWYAETYVPGEYRFEVVGGTERDAQVLLLFSVFVDQPPAPLTQLPEATAAVQDPMAATDSLYDALNALRQDAGLAPVQRFEAYEPLSRQHAALLAAKGEASHYIPGVTAGVAALASFTFAPQAIHHENVAAAPTWQEALDLVALSPGHASNLLCAPCTHASIGVVVEPVLDRVPRLFVVWELLEFPNGAPRSTADWDRR